MKQASKYTFAAIFAKEQDGGFSIRFPQLDGCFTQGDNFEQAMQNAVDAMSLHIYGMEQDGEAIPEAELSQDAGNGESIVLVTAWMTPFREAMDNASVKKTLSIPAWLDKAAQERKVNYSQVLQNALKDYIGQYHP